MLCSCAAITHNLRYNWIHVRGLLAVKLAQVLRTFASKTIAPANPALIFPCGIDSFANWQTDLIYKIEQFEWY